MAPYRKQSQKDIRFEERLWVTKGLLISMKTQEKDLLIKHEISDHYKRYRNIIVHKKEQEESLHILFCKNQGNVKKNLRWCKKCN